MVAAHEFRHNICLFSLLLGLTGDADEDQEGCLENSVSTPSESDYALFFPASSRPPSDDLLEL
jgi:hypothetical protein